jgi:hypothetical protein
LQGERGLVKDIKGMLKITVDYYTSLFFSEDRLDINLEDVLHDHDLVTDEHNNILVLILLNMRLGMLFLALMLKGALALMVFLSYFTNIWDLIKPDLRLWLMTGTKQSWIFLG